MLKPHFTFCLHLTVLHISIFIKNYISNVTNILTAEVLMENIIHYWTSFPKLNQNAQKIDEIKTEDCCFGYIKTFSK